MVSTPSRFAVSSAANRVAADIERTVQRHTAAACKRNQFGHTFLIKIALRREHADDNAVRAERGKALHLTASSSNSLSVYKKSPQRGRSSTRTGTETRSRTMRNRSSSGEVTADH